MIVPYKEGMDILEKLETAQNMSDKKRLLRKIQRYTVSVYENKLKECLQNGVIEESRFLPDVYVAKNYDMEKDCSMNLYYNIIEKGGKKNGKRKCNRI